MNIDKMFSEVVGELGYQQIIYCVLVSLINAYSAFQMLQYKFVARDSATFYCIHTNANKSDDSPEKSLTNMCGLETNPTTRYVDSAIAYCIWHS